jgi:hypothetical protein
MTGKLFWFNGNDRNEVAIGRTIIAPNTWNHVIAIRVKNHIKLLLNGYFFPRRRNKLLFLCFGLSG